MYWEALPGASVTCGQVNCPQWDTCIHLMCTSRRPPPPITPPPAPGMLDTPWACLHAADPVLCSPSSSAAAVHPLRAPVPWEGALRCGFLNTAHEAGSIKGQ